MAKQLGADSLRYLPVESVARAICLDADQLCRACITGEYPTPCGRELAKQAMDNYLNGVEGRTYETDNHCNTA
jgi:amidophosphoribosyltransferase